MFRKRDKFHDQEDNENKCAGRSFFAVMMESDENFLLDRTRKKKQTQNKRTFLRSAQLTRMSTKEFGKLLLVIVSRYSMMDQNHEETFLDLNTRTQTQREKSRRLTLSTGTFRRRETRRDNRGIALNSDVCTEINKYFIDLTTPGPHLIEYSQMRKFFC